MATTAQRLTALEAAVAGLTTRVAALEVAAPTPTPPPVPDPPTPPVTPPPAGSVGVPAGTALVASPGFTADVAGKVYDRLDVSGPIIVIARGVVIRRSRIRGSGPCAVWVKDGGSVVIEDSEIVGAENGVGFGSYTLRRCHVHGQYGDGLKLGSDCLVEDSVIDGLKPAAGAHADGGQVQFGVTNLTVRRSTFDVSTCDGNAALFISPDQGPSTDGPVLIEGNTLKGGNYTIYVVDGNYGQYVVRNITVRGNVIAAGQYGTHNVNVPVTWTGNVTPAGQAIPL